jgi:predicted ferric reductase
MRPNLLSAVIGIFIVIAVMLLIELYAFKSIAVSLDNVAPLTRKLVIWGYWLLTAGVFTLSILAMVNFRAWRSDHPTLLMISMAAFMVIGAPKLVLASFHLIDDLLFEDRYWGDLGFIHLCFAKRFCRRYRFS